MHSAEAGGGQRGALEEAVLFAVGRVSGRRGEDYGGGLLEGSKSSVFTLMHYHQMLFLPLATRTHVH